MLFFNGVAFAPDYRGHNVNDNRRMPSVSTKKPAVKTKEKTAKPVAIAAKRKPVSEAKEATHTMDARSSKDRRQDERRQKSVPVPASAG